MGKIVKYLFVPTHVFLLSASSPNRQWCRLYFVKERAFFCVIYSRCSCWELLPHFKLRHPRIIPRIDAIQKGSPLDLELKISFALTFFAFLCTHLWWDGVLVKICRLPVNIPPHLNCLSTPFLLSSECCMFAVFCSVFCEGDELGHERLSRKGLFCQFFWWFEIIQSSCIITRGDKPKNQRRRSCHW